MGRRWQDTQAAFGAALPPMATTLIYCCLFGWAIELLSAGAVVAIGAAIMFAIAALILAFALTAGALGLVLDTRRLCLPAGSAVLQRTKTVLALAIAAAVVLPGALLTTVLGPSAWIPTLAILASALAGMLLPLLPTATILALVASPLLALWGANAASPLAATIGASVLSAVTAVLAVLVGVRWSQVMKGDPIRVGSRWVMRWLPLSLGDERLLYRPDAEFAVLRRRSGPDAPEAVIRTYLGPPFASASLRRRLIEATATLLAVGVELGVLAWLYSGGSWHWQKAWQLGLPWVVMLVWGVVPAPYLFRLQRLMSRGTSDLSELALTPGLGNARAQMGALYRATCWQPMVRITVVAALALLALVVGHSLPFFYAYLPAWYAAVVLTYLLQVQSALAGRAGKGLATALPLGLVGYFGALGTVTLQHAPPIWALLYLLIFLVPLLVATAYLGRRLAARPHPFLA
jgi:hypothetical protein